MGKPLFKSNGQFNGSLPDPVKPPTAAPIISTAPAVQGSVETPVSDMSFDFFQKNVPQEIVDLGLEMLDYADEIEFVNHNLRHGEEYATLQDMIDNPKMFNNNCGPATWAIIEQLDPLPDNHTAAPIQLQYLEGIHVAVLLTDHSTGAEYILDYTAKQYWDKLPVPLITTRKTWERVIDNYVRVLFKDRRK